MTKLFVGGIPYSCSNQQLEELFGKFGTVSSAQIITDKYSGQSKGFAFVEMSSDEDAQKAVKELDGYGLDGRRIGVSVAKPLEDNRNSFSGRDRGNNNSNRNRRY
jgi:RNA recognition motif-containing protein